jgi:hypothetical protein
MLATAPPEPDFEVVEVRFVGRFAGDFAGVRALVVERDREPDGRLRGGEVVRVAMLEA